MHLVLQKRYLSKNQSDMAENESPTRQSTGPAFRGPVISALGDCMNHRAILFILLLSFNLSFSLNGYCLDKYPPLTEQSILNDHYYTTFGHDEVKFTDGVYKEETPDSYHEMFVHNDLIRGDLNHDGNEDVAVIYAEVSGGSGEYFNLTVFLNENGKPRNVDSYFIGDGINIEKIYYKNAAIFIQAIIDNDDDPHCCPSKRVLMKFILQNNKLVKDEVTTLGTIDNHDSNP
jgi:hypothetical protein